MAMACSVFPDQATLPGPLTGDGLGGASVGGGAGEPAEPSAGEPAVTPSGGAAGGREPDGGGGSGGRAGGSIAGSGGIEPTAGSGGTGGTGGTGTSVCADPKTYVASTALDLWIGAAAPKTNHGSEPSLFVNGGSDERRAIFEVTVPAAPEGAVLLSAEVVLQLEPNADASSAERRLGLFLLQPHEVVESGATWERYGTNGQTKWTEGGDLGEQISEVAIPAGTSGGAVRFDVTEDVGSVLGAQASTYGLAVLDLGEALAEPSALAFTSREGNASRAASLRLSYCE